MDDTLTRMVYERLQADRAIDEDWSLYVIGACDGPDELEEILGGAEAPRAELSEPSASETPKGAYVSSTSLGGPDQPMPETRTLVSRTAQIKSPAALP